MEKVLINDLSTHAKKYNKIVNEAIEKVLSSGWFVVGPELKEFERKFASYCGVNFCAGVANGTDALELGLKCVGLNGGDIVATAANAGMYATNAILSASMKPYFIDVDWDTKSITYETAKKAIEYGAKAIIVTHLYGLANPDTEKLRTLCDDNQVYLIEDCAQAHGAKIKDKTVGGFGHLSAFSFYPTKNLGAIGDGGCVLTNDQIIYDRLVSLRQYGWSEKYNVTMLGGRNSRLDELQAAVLNAKLPFLDEMNKSRRRVAQLYNEKITSDRVLKPMFIGEEYVAHLYVLRTEDRQSLRDWLYCNGVVSEVHYPIPDYKQKIFHDKYQQIELPNTNRLSDSVITLPCYPEMALEQVEFIANLVNQWNA